LPKSANQIRVKTRLAPIPVAGQPERYVGLNRGGEVGRPAVIGGPRAVVPLTRADPPGGGGGLLLGTDTEKLPQEEILGVHGDVGLEFALPPPLVTLTFQQGANRSVQARSGGDIAISHGRPLGRARAVIIHLPRRAQGRRGDRK